MEMRLEKNNCNLLRKTRNFYSVTPRLQLSYLDYLLKLKWGGGYSEAIRARLPVKFTFGGGILKLKSHKVPRSLTIFILGGGILKLKSHKVPRSLTIFILGGGYSEAHLVFCMGSVSVLHLLFLNIILYFMNVWVTTYIYYYFLLFLLYCLYFIKEKSNLKS